MKYLKCTFACCVWLYWYAKECSVRGGRWWRCCGKGWYCKRLVKGNKRMKGEYLVISWTVYHLINVWPSNWKIGNRNNTKKEKLLFLMSSLPPSLAYTLTSCIFHFLSLDISPLQMSMCYVWQYSLLSIQGHLRGDLGFKYLPSHNMNTVVGVWFRNTYSGEFFLGDLVYDDVNDITSIKIWKVPLPLYTIIQSATIKTYNKCNDYCWLITIITH